MHKHLLRLGIPIIVFAAVLIFAIAPAGAAPTGPSRQFDDPVEQGEYLTTVAGCIGCHTPVDPETRQPLPGMEFAGGEPFDLGPLGIVYTKNLTSDEETGLGAWTDQEIKDAITTGVSPDGLHQFPIMPYRYYNQMADSDLDAIVAFLRSLPPVNNAVERRQVLPVEALPALPREDGIVAPDASDPLVRGRYLLTAVIACSECHTPTDPETSAPIQDKYFAGGQPFEGPWGIVYAGNITPDEETGLGLWSHDDVARILRAGVRPDGRQVVLMPWQEFTVLTDEDLNAVVTFLREGVEPVNNEVPAADLAPEWERFVEIPEVATEEAPPEEEIVRNPPDAGTSTILAVVVVVLAVLGIGAAFMGNRRETGS